MELEVEVTKKRYFQEAWRQKGWGADGGAALLVARQRRVTSTGKHDARQRCWA